MTKKIVGRSPSSSKKNIGNADCKVNEIGANIIPMVEKIVHAVRTEDEIEEIQHDTMYINPKVVINLRVIKTIETTFDSNAPNYYPEMDAHINRESSNSEFYDLSGVRHEPGPEHNAIAIKVNGNIAAYYLPDINSWLTGFWTWHIHYVTMVLGQVFPQILEQLRIPECPNAINAKSKTPIKRLTVSMGADPELEVTKNGKVVNASSVIQVANHLATQIGLDGQQSQLEFRPKPGTPQQVVKNIKKLVKDFSRKYPDYDLSDEGDRYPLGGHIHVGLGQSVEASSDLRMILDDFVGRPTLDMSGEARSCYRQLGATRSQPHGFEYRSTPAAVFQNPAMTFITLRLVKNLCEKYFNQDIMEYSDKPNIQDYINVGGLTKNQAKYFMKFCQGYRPQKSIRASWKVPAAPITETQTFPLQIEFHDNWNDGVANHIRDEILLQNIETSRQIVISFYGLRAERGNNICTVPLSGCASYVEDNPKPSWEEDHIMNIGLSADIRSNGLTSSQRREIGRNIRAILIAEGVIA